MPHSTAAKTDQHEESSSPDESLSRWAPEDPFLAAYARERAAKAQINRIGDELAVAEQGFGFDSPEADGEVLDARINLAHAIKEDELEKAFATPPTTLAGAMALVELAAEGGGCHRVGEEEVDSIFASLRAFLASLGTGPGLPPETPTSG